MTKDKQWVVTFMAYDVPGANREEAIERARQMARQNPEAMAVEVVPQG